MFLGSEYELLSYISNKYKRHEDGYLRFSEEHFLQSFSDKGSLLYLKILENKGLVTKSSGLIIVNTFSWAELFCNELNNALKEIDRSIDCKYNSTLDKVEILENNISKVFFVLKFNEDEVYKKGNIINMYFTNTFDNDIFWLNILNDSNLVYMLYSFIKNEMSSFNYKHRKTFSFLKGLRKNI